QLRNRKNLLEAVKHEVVARLSQSLHNQMEVLINVPKQFQPQQVKRIWDISVKIGDRPILKLSPDADIIDVFDDPVVGGRLLILGAPGSGKTTTLLELGQELVIRAQMDGELGIPVFLNLSSWRDDQQSIEEWLVEELRWKYGVSRNIGKRLVEGKQLLPMLDGLDELESSRQGLCVEAINRFLLGECRPGFLVVCSRLEEYESVGGELCLNGAVCLLPLSDSQVEGYLLGFGKGELWEWVRGDVELLEFVRVPLFLSMVVVAEVYLRKWGELKRDERLDFLLDAYVVRMLERRVDSRFYGEKGVPSDERTLRWLGWLASQLEKHSLTEFLIESLEPVWLENKRDKRIYKVILGLIFGCFSWFFSKNIQLIFIHGIAALSINTDDKNNGFYPNPATTEVMKFSWKQYRQSCRIILLLPIRIKQIFTIHRQEFLMELKQVFKNKIVLGVQILCTLFSLLCLLAFLFGNSPDNVKLNFLISFVLFNLMPILFLGLKIIIEIIGIIGFMIIFGGLQTQEFNYKIYPNEGIWRSLLNAIFLTIIILPISVIMVLFSKSNNFELISGILLFLSKILPFFAFLILGMSVIQHLILRITFFLTKKAPWNYARFLNYATEKMLLQRVGGGYRFIHRLLQQRLAWRYNNQQK
ncbi:MAG: NACHT domain-containing protein, partial [Okeania sp. SIO2D1]|nr:NACHT domain-containing protein [Okeania sp. SIO2D1]